MQIHVCVVLSISDNGCLLQSSEEVPLGSRVNMTLNLPEVDSRTIRPIGRATGVCTVCECELFILGADRRL